MLVGVPDESPERRVSLPPQAAKRLGDAGHEVVVAPHAGQRAGFSDDDYRAAGARIDADAWSADVVAVITRPSPDRLAAMRPGALLVGFLEPLDPALGHILRGGQLSAVALELIPRSTVAQSMDALSSQATVAGYAAVLLAAQSAARLFPMMVTAAGTLPPAKVLVLGVGVAGLQAIATAKRLGALVSAYDIRPETEEQVASLGATFVAAPTAEAVEGGYARQVEADVRQRQLDALTPHVAGADVVITTAQVPGRKAPLLITTDMVQAMQPGSVIVDMAAGSGGNCEPTIADQIVDVAGVTVLGPTDLASRMAGDASRMYGRNLTALFELLGPDGDIDLDNEILAAACVAHRGELRNDRLADPVGHPS